MFPIPTFLATHRRWFVHGAHLDVVDEGNMIAGMPVQGIEDRIEVDGVEQLVNGLQYLQGRKVSEVVEG